MIQTSKGDRVNVEDSESHRNVASETPSKDIENAISHKADCVPVSVASGLCF